MAETRKAEESSRELSVVKICLMRAGCRAHTSGNGERLANDELGRMNPAQRCNIKRYPIVKQHELRTLLNT